jgi:hypothetical protein
MNIRSNSSNSISSAVEDKLNTGSEQPKKKLGRPTKEEVLRRAKIARDADFALRKELLERQRLSQIEMAVSGSMSGSITETSGGIVDMRDPNWIPKYPIFLIGQRVEQKSGSKTFRGRVAYDSMNSEMVRVQWDNGSYQAASKSNLTIIYKKVYKNVYKQERKTTKRVPKSNP